VQDIVDFWQARTDEQLGETIGYASEGFVARSWSMGNWITDAWRRSLPHADVALTNSGGIRAGLDAGSFTLGDIIGILPFDNEILTIELRGDALVDAVGRAHSGCASLGEQCIVPLSGAYYEVGAFGGVDLVLAGGLPVEDEATYQVLVNDYMYYGGDGFALMAADPTPEPSGMGLRDPVIEWSEAVSSTEENPIELTTGAERRDALAFAEVLGHSRDGVFLRSWTMANWVTDAWLAERPSAELALTNSGGFQAWVDSGPLTSGDLMAMMPFESFLVEVSSNGEEIEQAIATFLATCPEPGCFARVAGMTYEVDGDDVEVTLVDGSPISPEGTYLLLMTDYLYGQLFPGGAPASVETGVSWREPVESWTAGLGTTEGLPLEGFVDDLPRGE